MKIDFAQKLTALDGREDPKAPTLRDMAISALTSPLRGDDEMTPTSKFGLGLLAQRMALSTSGEIEVTAEEIATIKDRIGRAYNPAGVVLAWQMLEGSAPIGN